jgi:hypothetical protein
MNTLKSATGGAMMRMTPLGVGLLLSVQPKRPPKNIILTPSSGVLLISELTRNLPGNLLSHAREVANKESEETRKAGEWNA